MLRQLIGKKSGQVIGHTTTLIRTPAFALAHRKNLLGTDCRPKMLTEIPSPYLGPVEGPKPIGCFARSICMSAFVVSPLLADHFASALLLQNKC